MSSFSPIDLSKVKTYPLSQRKNKVSIKDFATPPKGNDVFMDFLDSLPNILAGQDFRKLIEHIVSAYNKGKPVVAMMGGHVIKCGLSPVIISLMEKGIINAIALNGAGSIHDFELALIGETSEDVAENIQNGTFGMSEETGWLMNEAIKDAAEKNCGMGEGLGRKLLELNPPYLEYSLLVASIRHEIPLTIHVAIGTDIIHQHPATDGAAIGQTSFTDFRTFVSVVSELGNGGVLLNLGSAVLLPEVFLKALTVARNLGHNVVNFTTANFDMIQHYRPNENVVKRPTNMGGQGYAFTGHHEIMIPLLANAIISRIFS
ncbi:MAG: hypothetical protein AABX51_09285 [Nanoarchaeota archaeon]